MHFLVQVGPEHDVAYVIKQYDALEHSVGICHREEVAVRH